MAICRLIAAACCIECTWDTLPIPLPDLPVTMYAPAGLPAAASCSPYSSQMQPTNMPVGEPSREPEVWPAQLKAADVSSSSMRCWGSIRLASLTASQAKQEGEAV